MEILDYVFDAFPEEKSRKVKEAELIQFKDLTQAFANRISDNLNKDISVCNAKDVLSFDKKRLSIEINPLLLIDKLSDKIDELTERIGELSYQIYISYIFDLNSDIYSLKYPIPVNIEESSDEYIASIPDLSLYAQGDNETEAIITLKDEIIALYSDLLQDKNNLGKIPQSWKNSLESFIEKR
ncbi:MAG TPA: hypothetical protein DCR71_02990 [Dehalococcoidia bacterium]|nr:hypothetical protein [Dehalococcoidia bacterium]